MNSIHTCPDCEVPTFKFPPAIPPAKTFTRRANEKPEWTHDAATSQRGEGVLWGHPQSSEKRQRGPATSRGDNDMQLK